AALKSLGLPSRPNVTHASPWGRIWGCPAKKLGHFERHSPRRDQRANAPRVIAPTPNGVGRRPRPGSKPRRRNDHLGGNRMFTQILDPTGNLFLTWIVALIPVAALLFMLAVLRWSAWIATLVGSVLTLLLGLWVWKMPLDSGLLAYAYGSATGVWNVDWITFWGVMLFNTMVVTGAFEKLRRWLISQGTQDVRVQTILFAWAFVAPILIALGIPDLDAIRVAAIANNAPVSYGALGAPIIALAAVTGYP